MLNCKDADYATAINPILFQYPREQRFALAIMQDVQSRFNYLPKETVFLIADYLDIPVSKLFSMATFYKAISLEKKGLYIIKVCDGTACHIRSSTIILDEIYSCLGLNPGEITADGRFSLETVNCLGACALAPVMMVNEHYYGSLTSARVREVLEMYGGNSDGE